MKSSHETMSRASWVWLMTCLLALAAACSSSKPEPPGALTYRLTKGQVGAVNGDADYCDDPASPCAAGEGDCDTRSQCVSGLACATNYGPRYGFSNSTSVCMPPSCADNVRNGSETGVDCGGNCAPCRSTCSGSPGGAGFCSQGSCLCGQGQGDCAVNAECQGGLTCQRIGAQFGFSSSTRVCAPAHCSNSVQDADETGADCGGSCGTCLPACTGTPGASGFCDTCKCTNGQGDCSGSQQCSVGLVCTRMGNQFGYGSNIDVCVAPHCGNQLQDAGETGVDCGGTCGTCLNSCTGTVGSANFCSGCKCSSGQGDCSSNADCQSGLTCQRRGRAFGFSATTDVCLSASCSNGVQDAGETGVDCGGSCGTCIDFDFDGGGTHACATIYGMVRCWGNNAYGQLGDGTTTSQSRPVTVSGLTAGYKLVAAGGSHSCALSNAGVLKCWGLNGSRQLGNGSTTDSSVPVNVASPPANIVQLKAGDSHTCARTSAGTVYCWGNNASGQSGNSVGGTVNTPTQVTGITTAVDLAVGSNHNCVALADGTVRCWGFASTRQLGNNSGVSTGTPVTAAGVGSALAVAAGERHSCALLSSGGAMCWGSNSDNSLAVGSGVNGRIPTAVLGLSGATRIVASGRATCALIGSGVSCWGYSSHGEIGDGTTPYVHTAPTAVTGLTGVSALGAGSYFFCARTGDTLSCWGDDSQGQLGKGFFMPINVPKQTAMTLSSLTALEAGSSSSCAVAAGRVYCWGSNDSGQLGDGTFIQHPVPNLVSAISSATDVSIGFRHACAVLSDGTVSCWGNNTYGQLGSASPPLSATPIAVPGLTSVTNIYAGYDHTCARRADGSLYCWGYNANGQLGQGTNTSSSTPTQVPGISGVTATAMTALNTCVVVTGGVVKCWGANNTGQSGNSSSSSDQWSPIVVSLPSAASAVGAGMQHACAVLANGQVYCWGSNSNGQLGNGMTGDFNPHAPAPVSNVTTATAISLGYLYSCAILNGGVVQCWGQGTMGQLGNKLNQDSPYAVVAISSNATLITTGAYHTCAVRAGAPFCWGEDVYGEVGIDRSQNFPFARPVLGL